MTKGFFDGWLAQGDAAAQAHKFCKTHPEEPGCSGGNPPACIPNPASHLQVRLTQNRPACGSFDYTFDVTNSSLCLDYRVQRNGTVRIANGPAACCQSGGTYYNDTPMPPQCGVPTPTGACQGKYINQLQDIPAGLCLATQGAYVQPPTDPGGGGGFPNCAGGENNAWDCDNETAHCGVDAWCSSFDNDVILQATAWRYAGGNQAWTTFSSPVTVCSGAGCPRVSECPSQVTISPCQAAPPPPSCNDDGLCDVGETEACSDCPCDNDSADGEWDPLVDCEPGELESPNCRDCLN
jgi:hypothetical protein